ALAIISPLLFYAFGLHSFFATTVGILLALILIFAARPDLIGFFFPQRRRGDGHRDPGLPGHRGGLPGRPRRDLGPPPPVGHPHPQDPDRGPDLVPSHASPLGRLLQVRDRRAGNVRGDPGTQS